MAKILMTAIVADIRNKLNGSVFSKNRYGAYVRTKVTPVNPQTAAQTAQRNSFATNAQAWRGLTESQRLSWAAAAPSFPVTDIFGNAKILSPSALYSKLNGNLAAIGATLIATAPSPVAVPAVVVSALVIDDSANTAIISFTPTPVPTDFALLIAATPAIGAGQSFVKNRFRQITVLAAATATGADINTAYVALFGAPVTGTKIFVQATLVSTTTGQRGLPSQISTIVVA